VLSLAAVAFAQTPGAPVSPGAVAPERATLAGIPVGGKSSDEVKKLANDLAARLLAYPLEISRGKHTTSVTPARLGAQIDTRSAVEAVFAQARGKDLISMIRVKLSGPEAREISLPVQLTDTGVAKGLRRFSVRIGAEAHNARLTKVAGKFKTLPERAGKELDGAALARTLQAALDAPDLRARVAASLTEEPSRNKWLQSVAPLKLEAGVRDALPHVTTADLKPITAELAMFSTPLGGSSRNRVHNIELACKAVDGTVLLPGDVFSYNDTVGPRVPSAGYREAPVIIKGQLQKGTGGGICQVSSTLYNAALMADMEITHRQHHAFPVHYLPAGRDATVVDGSIDFRFKNRLAHPVAIDAKVATGRVAFHLYGHPDDKRQVEIVRSGISVIPTKTETVSDAKLPKGRRVTEIKPMAGHRVTVTRVVKKDGEVLRREVISHDYYRPVTGTVRVGTAVAASPRKSKSDDKPAKDPAAPAAKPDTPAASTEGA
jgi:vancomycin resistance protein YoaR